MKMMLGRAQFPSRWKWIIAVFGLGGFIASAQADMILHLSGSLGNSVASWSASGSLSPDDFTAVVSTTTANLRFPDDDDSDYVPLSLLSSSGSSLVLDSGFDLNFTGTLTYAFDFESGTDPSFSIVGGVDTVSVVEADSSVRFNPLTSRTYPGVAAPGDLNEISWSGFGTITLHDSFENVFTPGTKSFTSSGGNITFMVSPIAVPEVSSFGLSAGLMALCLMRRRSPTRRAFV